MKRKGIVIVLTRRIGPTFPEVWGLGLSQSKCNSKLSGQISLKIILNGIKISKLYVKQLSLMDTLLVFD